MHCAGPMWSAKRCWVTKCQYGLLHRGTRHREGFPTQYLPLKKNRRGHDGHAGFILTTMVRESKSDAPYPCVRQEKSFRSFYATE